MAVSFLARATARATARAAAGVRAGAAPRARPAFTLMELVVAIAILALISAVALPAFSTSRGDAVMATADEVVALLEHARALALERGQVARAGVNLTTGAYALVVAGSADDVRPARRGVLDLSAGVRLGTPDGDRTRAVALFDALGHASCDVITVERGMVRAEVQCDPWTGAIAARR